MVNAILEHGRVDANYLEVLRRQLYAGGKIERPEADFLVELQKRVRHSTPAFRRVFYEALKGHILAHGRIDLEEVGWLRRMLLGDGRIDHEERALLHALRMEARYICPEFELLFAESMTPRRAQLPCA